MVKTIYIIDDDAISNYITSLLITSKLKDAKIKSFENPLIALANIAKTKIEPDSAILLDLNMPEMNGYEFLEKISEKGITCPVFILTNSKNLIEREYASKFKQVKAFFSKPLSQDNIEQFTELNIA